MLQKRLGGQGNDAMILRYPTPETLYKYTPMLPGFGDKCVADCPKLFCLHDLCMSYYFTQTHFPLTRPISIPVGEEHKNNKIKSR